jgi:LysM repeat protein
MAEIKDSIGIEKKDGKTFVLHKVDAKETLYSIARKYNSKVDEIKVANPGIEAGLKIGQVLKVPVKTTSLSASLAATLEHTVQQGETLYGIAKKYNLSVEELTALNEGSVKELKPGQVLKVVSVSTPSAISTPEPVENNDQKIHKVELSETLFGIAKKYNVSVDDLKQANPDLINGLKEGMEIKIPEKSKTKNTSSAKSTNEVKTEKTVTTSGKGDFKKINETGFAELIENNTGSPKFHAFHKTAPIGTIVQVINQDNNEKIFVRVVGKLSDSENSQTIIKISQKGMERLKSKENRIAVSLSYIP